MAIVGIVTIAQMHACACLDNKQLAVADHAATARSSPRGRMVPWHDTCEKMAKVETPFNSDLRRAIAGVEQRECGTSGR
jgi:hypothetical protein